MLQQKIVWEQLFALNDLSSSAHADGGHYELLSEVIIIYYVTLANGMRATFCSVWPQVVEVIDGGYKAWGLQVDGGHHVIEGHHVAM